MSNAAKSGETSAPKKGKLPLVIGLVVLLAGGGGGAYWWMASQKASAAEPEGHGKASAGHDAEPAEEGESALLALGVFTVNLADTEAQRFLRTNVQLVLAADEAALKELEEEKLPVARARSAVLELLSAQKSSDLATVDGKDALKKVIAERAGKVLHHEVHDVLFSDFVIQF